MSKLIPQTFIDDLLAKIDIVEIISTRVKLKRTGSNLVGLCPFHTEKTPSFTVSQNKQFYHCFGCGTHGNAISFIMQFERLEFVETIENLASLAGLTVPKTSSQQEKTNYSEFFQMTEKAAYFYSKQLAKSKRAIDYLKSRGLTGEICKTFRVGFATKDWENLQSIHKNSLGAKKQMQTVGLLSEKEGKYYSRFRDRIMFPIRNARGNIIGFGGRAIDQDPAKYLNSPETPIFHKGEELYGLYEAKKAQYKLDYMIIVEGYLDVIALAQFGVTNTAATLGTAISAKQIQLLLRHTSEIIFCFDGDLAGQKAAWRALENSLPLMRDGIQIKFLFLPEGTDPDNIIRKESKENFIKRLETATTLSDFFINHLSSNINLNTLDGKAKLVKISKDLLSKMSQGVFYQLLAKKIANIANITLEELQNAEFNQNLRKEEQNIDSITTPSKEIPIPIQNIINILLHDPKLICYIDSVDSLKEIALPGMNIVLDLIFLVKKQEAITAGGILEHFRGREEFELLNKLACKSPIIPKDTLKNELIGIIQLVEELKKEQTIMSLFEKASAKTLSAEGKQKLQDLIKNTKNR